MFFTTSCALLLALASALVADAAIYVTQPTAGSTYHGGQSVTIEWLDDGQAPLLSSIGSTRVALYTGEMQLVQTIQPVNVSDAHSLTFTPNPKAGPNSASYYIAFVPTSDSTYRGYSPWFSLDNMSGSFGSPDPAATSSLPLPSASTSASGNYTVSETKTETTATTTSGASKESTTVVSTQTTETQTTTGTTEATSSGFSTSRSITASSTRTATSSTSTSTNAAILNNVPATGFAWTLLAFIGIALF